MSLPFSYSLHKVLCLIFGFLSFHTNAICVLYNKLVIDVVTKARWINFETANG